MSNSALKIIEFDFWGKNEFNNGGMRIHWENEEERGSIAFHKIKDDEIIIDNECTSKGFINQIFFDIIKDSPLVSSYEDDKCEQ